MLRLSRLVSMECGKCRNTRDYTVDGLYRCTGEVSHMLQHTPSRSLSSGHMQSADWQLQVTIDNSVTASAAQRWSHRKRRRIDRIMEGYRTSDAHVPRWAMIS